jgi:hypothetical protein
VWGERGETVLLCAAVLCVLSGPAEKLQPRLRQVAAQVSLFLTKCARKKCGGKMRQRKNGGKIRQRKMAGKCGKMRQKKSGGKILAGKNGGKIRQRKNGGKILAGKVAEK